MMRSNMGLRDASASKKTNVEPPTGTMFCVMMYPHWRVAMLVSDEACRSDFSSSLDRHPTAI